MLSEGDGDFDETERLLDELEKELSR